jgi:hypothetical protein
MLKANYIWFIVRCMLMKTKISIIQTNFIHTTNSSISSTTVLFGIGFGTLVTTFGRCNVSFCDGITLKFDFTVVEVLAGDAQWTTRRTLPQVLVSKV